MTKVLTEIADNSMANKDYASALSAYQGLEQTAEIKEREYKLAQICYDEGFFEEATSAYESLGQYELSLSKLPIARYAWADQLFKEGEYAKAAEQFALLGDMTDSATRANESIYQLASEKLTAKSYDDAKDLFNSIANYKDAGALTKECDYRKATDLLADGNNKDAETIFKSLGEYSDSQTKAEECIYNQAEILFTAQKYAEAKPLYDEITYSDSQTKSKQCVYSQAEALFIAGKYAEAKPLYDSIDYSDSQTKSKQCVYNQAEALFAAKKYNDASKMYASIDYLDSKDKAKLSTYQEAETYYSSKKYAEAEVIFLSLKDYSDSADRAKDCHLQQGIVLMDAEDYRGALEFFETVEYGNSADLAAKCHYELGRISHLAGKTDEAVAEYAYAVSLPEACSALLSAAKDYSVINEQEKAIQTLWLIRNQEDAQNELIKVATKANQNKQTDLALLAYSIFEEHPEIDFVDLYQNTSYDSIKNLVENCSLLADGLEYKEYTMYHFAAMARDYGIYDVSVQAYSDLGEYGDSATKVLETKYDQGEAKSERADWDGAIEAFSAVKEYKDAASKVVECKYSKATSLKDDKNYEEALDIFIEITDYKDAKEQIKACYYEIGKNLELRDNLVSALDSYQKAMDYEDASERAVAVQNEINYRKATNLYNSGEYIKSQEIYQKITGYKDSEKKVQDCKSKREARVKTFKTVGSIVEFGSYPQLSSGKDDTPIEWIVLETKGNSSLLLSRYGLDKRPFHNTSDNFRSKENIYWGNCDLRTWLNDSFLSNAFTSAESEAILTTNVDNGRSQGFDKWVIVDGKNTQDKIFLLSSSEANKYFNVSTDYNNSQASIKLTEYAEKQKYSSFWWLRTVSGDYTYTLPTCVSHEFGYLERNFADLIGIIRPALWINLSSGFF